LIEGRASHGGRDGRGPQRELRRGDWGRREELEQTLGGPNKPARIVAETQNEPAGWQPAQERDRGVQKRLIVIDVETPNPQIAKPAVTGLDSPRREEVRERGGGAFAILR